MVHVNYEFRWKNFRGFRDTGWVKLKPLTILLGPNNSGKSSAIAPLLLLNQTISSRDTVTPLVSRGPLVDVGTYKDFIFDKDTRKNLYLGFRYHVHDPNPDTMELGSYPPGAIGVTFSSGANERDVLLERYELFDVYKRRFITRRRLASGSFSLSRPKLSEMKKEERFAVRKSSPVNFLFSPEVTLYEYIAQNRSRKRQDAARSPEEFSLAFSDYLGTVGFVSEELSSLFGPLSYIGPARRRPQRYYEPSGEIPRSVGPRGEHTANLLARKFGDLSEELDRWAQRFEFGKKIKVTDFRDGLFSILFQDIDGKRETNLADAGFGVSQVLPLVVQALAARPNSLTIAEQPEIHLNPRLQCVLADLFAHMANTDHRVVVETHSEHMILRLRRLIAEGEIKSDDVALYFVEKSGGESTIRPIPIGENGHVSSDFWPKGFFEESLRESLALAAEQSKPKRSRGE